MMVKKRGDIVMRPAYYVIDAATNTPIPAVIRPAVRRHFEKTESEHWQAFGIQLSIDYGYGSTIYLKAKASELREYYNWEFRGYSF